MLLITFAVAQEAASFRRVARDLPAVRIVLTGIGAETAVRRVAEACRRDSPRAVITAGFAGGLNPKWPTGTVLYDLDPGWKVAADLEAAGAVAGKFHHSARVLTTAVEKGELWRQGGADAVEMESAAIRAYCAQQGMPSATVRVVLDAASDDLPLDFNQFINPAGRIRYGHLLSSLWRSPPSLGGLLRLQQQSRVAADSLARCLRAFTARL